MNKIFLLGFMGCGKSTIGKLFAKRLGVSFIDLDHYIEKQEGKEVAEIFREDGESGFRALERKYLEQVSEQQEAALISLGGGTPCFLSNMEYISRQGQSVYLQTDIEILVGRLAQNNSKRPLVAGKSKPEIREAIQSLMAKREVYYEQANFIIENSGGTSEALRRLELLELK